MSLRKILHTTAKILFNIAVILFALVMLANIITTDESVANLLTDQVFKGSLREPVSYSTGLEPVRYKTWYSSTEDVLDGNGEIAWLAQAEGSVLLKNDGNALPLSSGEKVSLFGVTAYDPMYSQDGAGNSKINDPNAYNGSTEANRRQYFYDEFERVGLDMNETLSNWYNSPAGMNYWRMDYVGFNGQSDSPRYRGYSSNNNGALPALTEARWSEIGESNMDRGNYGSGTTAVYITGRMSNESADLNAEGAGSCGTNYNNDGVKGSTDYLAFTADEIDLLSNLRNNYEKVIVIFNQANPPQADLPEILEQYADAALWIGYPGSDGIRAVADILVGTVNPSGGLSAMWYASRNANPSTQNFATNTNANNNVVNVEGMYVGYRYAETRYEDVLLGSDGAGTYDYGTQVSYPFGYGLSYSSGFTYSDVEIVPDEDPEKNYYSGGLMASNINKLDAESEVEAYTGNYGKAVPIEERRATGAQPGDCDDLILRVTVTNATEANGGVAGKEIVQVYLQQPEGPDDESHGVQKPSVQLVGYGKTDILQPGASQTVEIKIDANKWFAAYDAYKQNDDGTQGGYVLSAGDYRLAVARNSHEAVNSIYKATHTGELPAAFDEEYGAGSGDNVVTVNVSQARSNSYSYWTQGTTDDVHNLFSDLDPNMDAGGSDKVTYFSRYDWETTAALNNGRIGQLATSVSGDSAAQTAEFNRMNQIYTADIDVFEAYFGVEFDDTAYTYGRNSGNADFEDLQLANLVGVEYDPARGASEEDVQRWADLVAKMSEQDFRTLYTQGRRRTMAIESITKPATDDQNASNGLEWAFGLGNSDKADDGFDDKISTNGFVNRFGQDDEIAFSTGYPCEGIRAATFNDEIAYLVGQAIGEDALWSGASGLYGFGLGMQRNPYHGRMGEFYSDDSFLTGRYGGYEVKGAQSKGLYVYNKHFVLNDQETRRNTYASWLDEQTFRQIYLRPFEMAIEIGDAMNVMIAFNKIGGCWGGSNYNLMTRWLRGEAGMAGFAVSDWYSSDNENIGYGMLAGTDLLDGVSAPCLSIGNDPRYDNCLVKSATRLLYTVANSNAMNFLGEDSRLHTYDPDWYVWRTNLVTATSVVFGLCCAFLVGTTVWTAVVNVRSRKAGKKRKR